VCRPPSSALCARALAAMALLALVACGPEVAGVAAGSAAAQAQRLKQAQEQQAAAQAQARAIEKLQQDHVESIDRQADRP